MPEATLISHPFLTGLSPAQIEIFEACLTGTSRWATNESVILRGGEADACHLLVTGTVAVEIRPPGSAPRTIQTVHGGELLGWSWLFEPHIWTFDARAVEESAALSFDAAGLRAAIDTECEFGLVVMRRVAKSIVNRLKATRLQVLDVYNR